MVYKLRLLVCQHVHRPMVMLFDFAQVAGNGNFRGEFSMFPVGRCNITQVLD